MKKILLTCLLALGSAALAQVGPPQATNPNTNNGYGFTQTTGTYTPLSASRTIWQSGAALGTDAVSAAINLPSAFKFNGKSYNAVYLSNNGFVTLGTAALAATYTGLSTDTTTPYEGAFAGFAANLKNANTTTSEISYETVGSKFIVQFKDLQGSGASAAQLLNFQIQFDLTSNNVSIVYGNCVSGTAVLTGQVGIRGSEASDTNNRVGTDWTATSIGTGSTDSVTLGTTNSTTVPASGLTFTYSPGTWIAPPATYAAIPFNESFTTWENGNSIGDLPNASYWRTWPSRGDNSWRASDITVNGYATTTGWTSVGGNTAIAAPGIAPAARFHSYNTINASGYMDLYINLSSGTGSRLLSYDYQNTSGTDVLKVLVSTDGGNTFNQVGSTQGISASWATKYADLGTSSPTAIVRFMATGDNGSNDIYIDNVNISVIPCMFPDSVTPGTTTSTTAPVSWTMANPAPAFDIYYSTTNTAPTAATTPNVVGATGLTYTITNLTPSTTYYVWVRSRCSASDQSSWVSGSSFATKTFCPTVSAPSSAATGVSVTPAFTWTANPEATGYRLSVGTTSGGTDVLNNLNVGNVSTYTLPTELTYNTKYYYTVNSYNAAISSTGCTERTFTTLSICPAQSAPAASAINVPLTPTFTWTASSSSAVTGYKLRIGTTPGGNDVLNNFDVGNVTTYTLPTSLNYSTAYYWSVGAYTATQNSLNCTERSFTTVCPAVTSLPVSENFDTTATGSSSNTNAPSCWRYLEPSSWAGYGYVNTSYNSSAPNGYYLYNDTATTAGGMLVSPQITPLSNGANRVRFMAVGGAAGYTLQVGTLSNPADASTFTQISSVTLTSTMAQYTVNIPAGTDQYLAFRHGVGGTYRGIGIDDINIQPVPSCDNPTLITVASTAANGAVISWTAPSSTVGVGYDVYYSTANTAPTATTVLNSTNSVSVAGTATTANLTGLANDTFYYVWARAKCSATDNSAWEGGTRFYTSNYCTPVTSNQNSWISSFTSTTANTNMAYSSATANSAATFGYKNLMSSNNISIAKSSSNTVIPVSITAGGPTVGMAVWVDLNQNNVFDASEKLYATTAYTTTTSGATLTIPANTSVGTYRMRVLINYNNSAPTDPCLGFSRGEIIDYSLIVTAPLATNELSGTKNDIKVYPNPFTDILNISDISNVRTVYVTDIAGRLVKTITHPESSVHLNELKEGMYLITLDMKDGSKQTFKAIKR